MKRTFLILPIVSVSGFIICYRWWAAERPPGRAQAREEGMFALKAAKEELRSDGSIVGRNGAGEANDDIARGAPKLLLYGRERADLAERTVLFRRRFGVTVDPLAGCVVNQPLIAFAEAYNATVQSYVSAKFGPTAFDQADRDAWQMWLSRHEHSPAGRAPDQTPSPGPPPAGRQPHLD